MSTELPGPRLTPDSRHFWQAVAECRFDLPYCNTCDRYFFYPRLLCPHCHESNWVWKSISGNGIVESFTVIRRPATPAFKDLMPRTLATIRLHEGPRLLAVMADLPRIGAEVAPIWEAGAGASMPAFRTIHESGGVMS